MSRNEKYVPALNFDWLTPLYDPVVKWLMPESEFKGRLIRQARIQPGQRVQRPGGGLHVADFRKSNESLAASIREAGFVQVEECAEYRTLFGKLALWQAQKF